MSSPSPVSPEFTGRNGLIVPHAAIEELKSSVKGDVLVRGEANEEVYRQAIYRWNENFIVEAAFVVFVENEVDIAAVLQFVQTWDLEVAIACGRHSYSGASASKGLVIDLAKMREVSIDNEAMTITAQGGCRAADLETPLQMQGLSVVFGNMNDTGIGGITLGGGSGLLTGQHGLVIDNLIAAKIVVADGTLYEASETINSDLFWAIRGGGSNFGVVTEFTYRIHKQGDVFFGPVLFTPDKTTQLIGLAESLQQIVDEAEGKLVLFFLFKRFPGAPKLSPGVIIFYDGPETKAKEILAPIFNLGPVVNMATTKPYADCTKAPPNRMMGFPTHTQFATKFIRMSYPFDIQIVQSLVNDLDAFIDKYGPAVAPSKMIFEFKSYKKAMSVPRSATSTAARQPGIDTMVEVQFDQSLDYETMRREAGEMVEKIRAELARRNPNQGIVVNANLSTGEDGAGIVFGDNLPRLRELKKRYDSAFVFNKWYPIEPAE